MRCIVYCRESSSKLKEALKYQLDELPKIARANNWQIIQRNGEDVFNEGFVPAEWIANRPVLREILKKAKRREFDILLVKHEHRIARAEKMQDVATIIETFKENKIKVALEGGKIYNLDDYRDYNALSNALNEGRAQNKNHGEKVMKGMLKGVMLGHYQGTRYVSFGYSYNKWQPPEKRKLEVIEKEAEIVKLIFSLYLSGATVGEIAKNLYEHNFRPRATNKSKYFHTKFLCDVLKNRVYLGELIWNRKHYLKNEPKNEEGAMEKPLKEPPKYVHNPQSEWKICKTAHEAMISEADFNKVQVLLQRRVKSHCQIKRIYEYCFSGIIRCFKCNTAYNGTSSVSVRKLHTRKRWYKCMGRQNYHNDCMNRPIKADAIEPHLFGIVEKILSHDIIKKRSYDSLLDRAKTIAEDNEVEAKVAELESKIAELKIRQDNLTDAYLDKITPKAIYQAKMSDIKLEIDLATAERVRLEACLVQKESSFEYQSMLKDIVNNFSETKQNLTYLEKRELLRLIFKRVSVEDAQIKEIELYEPFETIKNEIFKGENICQMKAVPRRQTEKDLVSTSGHSVAR